MPPIRPARREGVKTEMLPTPSCHNSKSINLKCHQHCPATTVGVSLKCCHPPPLRRPPTRVCVNLKCCQRHHSTGCVSLKCCQSRPATRVDDLPQMPPTPSCHKSRCLSQISTNSVRPQGFEPNLKCRHKGRC